jgi:hypothetical protein
MVILKTIKIENELELEQNLQIFLQNFDNNIVWDFWFDHYSVTVKRLFTQSNNITLKFYYNLNGNSDNYHDLNICDNSFPEFSWMHKYLRPNYPTSLDLGEENLENNLKEILFDIFRFSKLMIFK